MKQKNRRFWTKNAPDRGKSRKIDAFFPESSPGTRQNMLRNRDFSEKPRWGPWKNRIKITKFRRLGRALQKAMIFSSGTLPTMLKRRFASEAEKYTILIEKCSGSGKIAENRCIFSRIVSCNAAEHGPKSWFFRKTSMGTLEKSSKVHEISTSR